MTNRVSPFSLDQIGFHAVRFSSTGIFETHKDQMVDPYAATRIPKEAQVEGTQYAPQSEGIFPSIVLLHDRWGYTSQMRETAKRLASEGYVVLVPNLYGRLGGMITANAEVADALMERLNENDAMQDINACCEFLNANLAEDTTLDLTKRNAHAVVGFGMGGSLAIRFACHRKRLKTAVAFYGNLPDSSEAAKRLYCPVLYHAAGTNSSVTQEEIDQFQQAAKQENKHVEVQFYSEASPGFCNETQPATYHEEAATRAWDATIDFLDKHFKNL
jgi:carboxymethylenebutenolidase